MSEMYGDVPPDRHEGLDDIDALLAHDERRRRWFGWRWLVAVVVAALIVWWLVATSRTPDSASLDPGAGQAAVGNSGDSDDSNVRMTGWADVRTLPDRA